MDDKTKKFIKKSKSIHGNKFNYLKCIFIDYKNKIELICNDCGNNFFVSVGSHIYQKTGCSVCSHKRGSIKRAKSHDKFIAEAKKKHGDRFDYSNTKYVSNSNKIQIKCNKCKDVLFVLPQNHLRNRIGCKRCSNKSNGKNRTYATSYFIKKARMVHGDQYDYSKTKYLNSKTRLEIKCKSCNNVIKPYPTNHLKGIGCKFCGIEKYASQKRDTTESFIKKAKAMHGNKYSYKFVDYKLSQIPVKIICNDCGNLFEQTPNRHIGNKCQGCPICSGSYYEQIISSWLRKSGIKFKKEKTFDSCRNPSTGCKLRFDFFIKPDILIEYHGQQHFKYVEHIHKSLDKFNESIARDKIKESWAEENQYYLYVLKSPKKIIKNLEAIFK